MLPDGCLVCLGRGDSVVKVRGQSVDIDEVEAVFLALDGIIQAAVVAQDVAGRDKRLVAYVVLASDGPTVSALRFAAREKLPDHMVPSKFVFMKALPLTPSGKVDRRALPSAGSSRPELDTPFLEATTPSKKRWRRSGLRFCLWTKSAFTTISSI